MQLYGFEPHQTELSHYVPGHFIDITAVYEKKVNAMKCFKAQSHLIEYYTQRAFMRGNHARRLSGCQEYRYAESFARVFPVVSTELL
jgi:4-oxalomesaconate hydratase